MEFNTALGEALEANGGTVTLQQAVDLLPNAQKHRVMFYLNAARNAGVCRYFAKRVGGESKVIIKTPVPENAPEGESE